MEYFVQVLEVCISETPHYKSSLPLFNGVHLENEHVFHLLLLSTLIRRKEGSLSTLCLAEQDPEHLLCTATV